MEFIFLRPAILSEREEQEKRALIALKILNKLREEESDEIMNNRSMRWSEEHKKMADHLKIENLLEFQCNPFLAPHIVGGGGNHFLERIEKKYGSSKLSFFLRNHNETRCGNPQDLQVTKETQITRTSMRHLYHLACIHDFCLNYYRFPIDFVEIGGGFGNLARMIYKYNLCNKYYIVDYPAPLTIQYFYISEFLNQKDIAVISDSGKFIQGETNARIILTTPKGLDIIENSIKKPYAMISTIALTEIPKNGQQQYISRLNPDFVYIFGQLQNLSAAEGSSLLDKPIFNLELIISLSKRFHTIQYEYFGYFFEYMGRSFK